jgi:hypothetical protein
VPCPSLAFAPISAAFALVFRAEPAPSSFLDSADCGVLAIGIAAKKKPGGPAIDLPLWLGLVLANDF